MVWVGPIARATFERCGVVLGGTGEIIRASVESSRQMLQVQNVPVLDALAALNRRSLHGGNG